MAIDDERRLMEILLEGKTTIFSEEEDKNRKFLDEMCQKGYLSRFGDEGVPTRYYNVNRKFKNKILDILRMK